MKENIRKSRDLLILFKVMLLEFVRDGITILQSIYNIKEQLDDNQEGGKLLCQRVQIFEAFFKDFENYEGEIRPFVKQAVEQLLVLLDEVKTYLEKFLAGGSLFQCGKRMILNIAFRHTIAADFAAFNQRINDIAIILIPGVVLNVEARMQEELDVFYKQLNNGFSQLTLDLVTVKDDTRIMTELIKDLMKETDSSNYFMFNILSDLMRKLNEQQAISSRDILELEDLWTRNQLNISEELKDHVTRAIVDMKERLDTVAEKEKAILEGVEDIKGELKIFKDIIIKILNDQSLNNQQRETRREIVEKLQISPSIPLQFLSGVELGKGGFGSVRLGLYQGNRVAVKSIRRTSSTFKDESEAVENEILLMNYVASHPNILTCYGYYNDSEKNLHLVLEYAKYNSLFRLICNETVFPTGVPIRLTFAWLCDLMKALQFIHSREVKHRDVKAENLLVLDGFVAKLCDFGLAKQHSSHKGASTVMAGTTAFMAPEVKQGLGSSYASDIFSWGMTAVQLITRRIPNHLTMTENLVATAMEEAKRDRDMSSHLDVLATFTSLVLKCVDRNPNKRPTAATVYTELNALLTGLGGDPRLMEGVDEDFMKPISERADDWSRRIVKGDEGKLFPLVSLSNPIPPPKAPVADVEVELPISNMIGLDQLNREMALALMVELGCPKDLESRLSEEVKNHFDGELLSLMEDVKELSKECHLSDVSSVLLRKIFSKLQTFKEKGIPSELLHRLQMKQNGTISLEKQIENHEDFESDLKVASEGYEGERDERSRRHGKGIYTFANGNVYEGDWKADNRHGKGTYFFSTGAVYEGDWKDDTMHGQGKYTYANGEVYEGDWKDDKKHGTGKYASTDGSVYEGDWRDDNRQVLEK